MMMVSALMVGLSASVADPAKASYSEFRPDLRGCFCDTLLGSVESVAFGQLRLRDGLFYLFVEAGYGPTAPLVGSEVLLQWALQSGPGGLILVISSRPENGESTFYVEAGKTLRYWGTAQSGWGDGYTFDEYCVDRREIDEVMSFMESIDFDYLRCREEIREALDLPEPESFDSEDSGCGGGGFGSGWSLGLAGWFGLWFRGRRRGRC
jgi:hypothetical protein